MTPSNPGFNSPQPVNKSGVVEIPVRGFGNEWMYPGHGNAKMASIPLWIELIAFPYRNFYTVRSARESDSTYDNFNYYSRFYLPMTGTMKTEDVAQYSPGNTPSRSIITKILESLDNPARFWAEGTPVGSESFKLFGEEFTGKAQIRGIINSDSKENLFGGMTFRTYGFNWEFLPWDEEEANYIMNLAYDLSTLAYPGYVGMVSKMKHPPVWGIRCYDDIPGESKMFRRTDWDFIPKLCVLQGVRTNRTKSGRVYTVGSLQSPSSISISATFVEIEPLIRFIDGKLYSRSEIKDVDPSWIPDDVKQNLFI
jgi:hypothetical protein